MAKSPRNLKVFEQKLFPLTAVTKRRKAAAKVAVGNLFFGRVS